MPVHNFRILQQLQAGQQPVPNQILLRQHMLRVPVLLTMHPNVLQTLTTPAPTPIAGMGLIDTGASLSSIDDKVAQQLGLQPTGTCKLGTASGVRIASRYPFRMSVHGSLNLDCVDGVGCDLAGQGIIALIGMDILSQGILIVNGPDATFSFSH